MASSSLNFYDWVQEHERTWGKRSYTGRPSLQSMMDAKVVVFWRTRDDKDKDRQYSVTLHNTLDDLQKYFARMLFTAIEVNPTRHVMAIFAEGKRVRIAGVQIEFRIDE